VSVLKPTGNTGTTNMIFKIPNDLHRRIESVKKRCKSSGFTIDFATGAARGVSKMLTVAEKELDEIESHENKSKTKTVEKKQTAGSSSASAGRS